MAITASFNPLTGLLFIVGDAPDNAIEVSRANNGDILINGGAIPIVGGTPNVNNTAQIVQFGLGGNDQLVLNEANGDLPRVFEFGGSGNDVAIGGSGQDYLSGSSGNDFLRGGDNNDRLFGGNGDDTLLGDRGNDEMHGGADNDLMIWNNGDGSDFVEGGDGLDTVQVNGANGAGDSFRISANGNRVLFERNNLGLFQLDIGTTENLDINGQGGSDGARQRRMGCQAAWRHHRQELRSRRRQACRCGPRQGFRRAGHGQGLGGA